MTERILLVEDNQEQLSLLNLLLQHFGGIPPEEIVLANSVDLALESLCRDSVSKMYLDISMPQGQKGETTLLVAKEAIIRGVNKIVVNSAMPEQRISEFTSQLTPGGNQEIIALAKYDLVSRLASQNHQS